MKYTKIFTLAACSTPALSTSLSGKDLAMQEALDRKFIDWYKKFTGYDGEVTLDDFADLNLGNTLKVNELTGDYYEGIKRVGYESAEMEFSGCHPYEQLYVMPGELINVEQIQEECDKLNESNSNMLCAQAVCKIDMMYVQNLYLEYFEDNYTVDQWEARYSVKNIYPRVSEMRGYDGLTKFCGDYPFRFPYRYENGKYDCCDGKIFSPKSNGWNTCCENGNVVKDEADC